MLVFHPALAPYRVDQFNFLSGLFELTVVFLFENVNNQNFDQRSLAGKLQFHHEYLLAGPSLGDRCFRWGILGCIRRHRPDIILSYEFSLTTQYLIFLKTLGVIRQPLGSAIDDSPEICINVQSWPRRVARSIGLNSLDYLVVLSDEVAEAYSRRHSFDRGRIVVSPLQQNPASLRKGENLEALAQGYAEKWGLLGKKVILYVGRFAAEKGLLPFLRTIAPCLAAQGELRLVLVGEGPKRSDLEAAVDELALGDKVLMPGRFEGADLHAWYLCASGFVLPSTYEPFGAVVNEALVFGLPVLCSCRAGSASMAQQAGGILFDPNHEADTVAAFERHLGELSPLTEISLARRPSRAAWNVEEMSAEWARLDAIPGRSRQEEAPCASAP